jgi:hypothetical protein
MTNKKGKNNEISKDSTEKGGRKVPIKENKIQ